MPTSALTALNCAVYDASALAITSCERAPPSDQLDHAYRTPPTSCGDGALSEFLDPRMTVRVNGVTLVVLPTASWSPPGFEPKVRLTVFGSRRTDVLACVPRLSVAVSFT